MSPGSHGPESPRGDGRGRGLGCQGAGLAEKTLGGGAAKGRRGALPVCLRGSTDSGHRPAVKGAFGWVREPRLGTFTFFLAAANLLCRISSDIPGQGGGRGVHIIAIPATTADTPGSHRAGLQLSQKGRDRGVSRLQLGGRGFNPLSLLVDKKDDRERGRG